MQSLMSLQEDTKTNTEKRTMCSGKGQTEAMRAQESDPTDCSHQKLGRRTGMNSPSKILEGTGPASTLILDFWSPEPGEKNYAVWNCLFCRDLLAASLGY